MEIKEYLTTTNYLKLNEVAKLMYPKNKDAATYLYKKLKGEERKFTRKDALLAQKVLKELGVELVYLTVADAY